MWSSPPATAEHDKFLVGSQTVANVPFFPTTLEELADDAAFSAKVALISNVRRVRVDISTRMTQRERHRVRFMLLLARGMLDDVVTHIHVFVDASLSLQRVQADWVSLCAEMATEGARAMGFEPTRSDAPASEAERAIFHAEHGKLTITAMRDECLPPPPKGAKAKKAAAALQPRAFVLLQPNNVFSQDPTVNLLDEVQSICFHSALRNIPVILVNPLLVSSSSQTGARDPLLLGDFCQAYFIHDDFLMMQRRDQFCGLVQRAATGFDLFLLDGLWTFSAASYLRLQSWPSGWPSNMRQAIADALLRQPGLSAFRDNLEAVFHGGVALNDPDEVFGRSGGRAQGQGQGQGQGVVRLKDDFLTRGQGKAGEAGEEEDGTERVLAPASGA